MNSMKSLMEFLLVFISREDLVCWHFVCVRLLNENANTPNFNRMDEPEPFTLNALHFEHPSLKNHPTYSHFERPPH